MVMTKLTLERVLERFHEIHGDRYDYSQVVWVNKQTRMTIVCREHGPFEHTFETHRKGRGCKSCWLEALRAKKERELLKYLQETYSELYDYSLISYERDRVPLKLVCPTHGVFEIAPYAIRQPTRSILCSACYSDRGRNSKLELGEILDRFKLRHGDRYDYSQLGYKSAHVPVEIICRQHGSFQMKAYVHWTGSGCPSCSTKIVSTADCVARFKEVHGERYDYSQVDYQGPEIAVVIICRTHGAFTSNPANHWKQAGESCTPCRAAKYKTTTAEIVNRFQKVHGHRYDYSRVRYEDMYKDVEIICHQHGSFFMAPANHLTNHACKFCARKDASNAQGIWFQALLPLLPGWLARQEVDLLGGRWGSVDLLLEKDGRSIVVEYDGQYWHSRQDSLDKDSRKTAALVALGHRVIRLRTQESLRHEPLPEVLGAVNIWVAAAPDEADLTLVATKITES
jgi:very-short-patch-repair endonuclease